MINVVYVASSVAEFVGGAGVGIVIERWRQTLKRRRLDVHMYVDTEESREDSTNEEV